MVYWLSTYLPDYLLWEEWDVGRRKEISQKGMQINAPEFCKAKTIFGLQHSVDNFIHDSIHGPRKNCKTV